jgi:hypothetical protein
MVEWHGRKLSTHSHTSQYSQPPLDVLSKPSRRAENRSSQRYRICALDDRFSSLTSHKTAIEDHARFMVRSRSAVRIRATANPGSVPKRSNGLGCKPSGSRLRRFESFPAHASSRPPFARRSLCFSASTAGACRSPHKIVLAALRTYFVGAPVNPKYPLTRLEIAGTFPLLRFFIF